MNTPIDIRTKNNTPEEQVVAAILKDVSNLYPVPLFTPEVMIESGAMSHSHPIITLNTSSDNPLVILKRFVHEQFHWFADSHEEYDACIAFLKEHYEDLGEGKLPNSNWEHLIVCWNTRNFLQNNLKMEEVEFVYNQWQGYPLTEKFVEENFEKIQTDLEKYKMIG